MEFTRTYMIGYLLLFCATDEEYEKEEDRLTGLTDEALEAEFNTTACKVPAPAIPSVKAIPLTSTPTFKTTQNSDQNSGGIIP